MGAAGIYTVPVGSVDKPTISTNYLVATGNSSANVYRSLTTSSGTDTNYRYIFAKDGSGNIGFYKLATDYSRTVDETTYYYHELAAHKAYLETSTDYTPTGSGGAPMLRLDFDEENNTTDVEAIKENDTIKKFFRDGQLLILRNGITYDSLGRIVR